MSGLQSKGVDATIKHFVANDQESERTGADSVMTDRALREIYLYPCVLFAIKLPLTADIRTRFMIAQKYGKPGAFMTSYVLKLTTSSSAINLTSTNSYGRLNGTHCSEDPWLLQTVLRGEWGFKGIVMSDW